MRTFETALEAARAAVAARLDLAFSALEETPVVAAMRYACGGGKGLRGFLVLESARLHGVSEQAAVSAAAGIEALHAYSLVHDDLPCMDDDDLRRGQPTVHRKWDEATAVLAGDGLQSLAFGLVADHEGGAPEGRIGLVQSLSRAAGAGGMVGGQAMDIAAETADRPPVLDEITRLQRAKTGALIVWSACAGPRLAGVPIQAMEAYAMALGLAFQIADDLLDVDGDAATLGKATGKDAAAGKATFVTHLGRDGAIGRAEELVRAACDALDPYGDKAEVLRQAARFVITRDH